MSNVPGPSRRSETGFFSIGGRNAPWAKPLRSHPEQLVDETSFLRQLQAILRVRSYYGIATRGQVDFPQVSTPPHARTRPPTGALAGTSSPLSTSPMRTSSIQSAPSTCPRAVGCRTCLPARLLPRSTIWTASRWRCRPTTACRSSSKAQTTRTPRDRRRDPTAGAGKRPIARIKAPSNDTCYIKWSSALVSVNGGQAGHRIGIGAVRPTRTGPPGRD